MTPLGLTEGGAIGLGQVLLGGFLLTCRLLVVLVLVLTTSSSGALYQNVATTGSRSASGLGGVLKSLAKPMSAAGGECGEGGGR
ncbi:hypothetical protein EYF80_004467 [Liparis tanakae]|uniref:Uncharacterized protein n=1 Tax=Liparis tanakae TaxID=230148 RepID=A0A4Z2J4Z7_9TELE|nr:hypothetical protein EYF80_004467 [Liparis tanakae]